MKITTEKLENIVRLLNIITKNNPEPWEKQPDGTMKQNKGNYHLDSGYGMYSLNVMLEAGEKQIFGFTTKKDLYNKIAAFLEGYECKCKEIE